MLSQLHAVVRDELVDVAVLVALGLRMADQYDHLRTSAGAWTSRYLDDILTVTRRSTYAGFPHLWPLLCEVV